MHLLLLLLEEPSLVYNIIACVVHNSKGIAGNSHKSGTGTSRFTGLDSTGHDRGQVMCLPPRPNGTCFKWAETGRDNNASGRIIRPVLRQVVIKIISCGRRRCRDKALGSKKFEPLLHQDMSGPDAASDSHLQRWLETNLDAMYVQFSQIFRSLTRPCL